MYIFSVKYKMTKTKSGRLIISTLPINHILTEIDLTFLDIGMNPKDMIVNIILKIAEVKNLLINIVQENIFNNFKTILSSIR